MESLASRKERGFDSDSRIVTSSKSIVLTNRNLSVVPMISKFADEVTNLDISHNKITILPASIFDSFCNISSLNVGNNFLMALPPELGSCTSLVILKICNNQLPLLPATIGKVVSLEKLDAGGNRIASISGALESLSRLRVLDLSRNAQTHIPDEDIWSVTSLTELSLSSNRLSALPLGVGNLTELVLLRASNNFISSLEPDVVRLPKLRELQLSQNNFSYLPSACWRKATNLTALDLSMNDLKSLPYQIGFLTSLQVLGLARNPRLSPRLVQTYFAGGASAVLQHLRDMKPEFEYDEGDGLSALKLAEEERKLRRKQKLNALISGQNGPAQGANRFYRELQNMLNQQHESTEEIQKVKDRLIKRMLRAEAE